MILKTETFSLVIVAVPVPKATSFTSKSVGASRAPVKPAKKVAPKKAAPKKKPAPKAKSRPKPKPKPAKKAGGKKRR